VGGISIALVPPTVCLLSWGPLRAGCRRGGYGRRLRWGFVARWM